MFKSYLTTALRHFRRQKAYSFINVAGLTVGLACSFFILIWVGRELSVNQFHESGDRLYQVKRHVAYPENTFTWNSIPYPVAGVLENDVPEVEDVVVITWQQQAVLRHEDRSFRERGFHTTPAMLTAFSFPMLLGDAATALDAPESITISETLAQKLFGDDWRTEALGAALDMNDGLATTVTGVFADLPEHSSIHFQYLRPLEPWLEGRDWLHHWGNSSLRMYVRLRDAAGLRGVNEQVATVVNDNHETTITTTVFLQPFEETYLYADFENGVQAGGRIEDVRIFTVIAFFILLIACINFMNLATAKSAQRAREIGIRKTVGASQASVVRQFLGESVLISLLSLLLAGVLVALLLPAFNTLTEFEMTLAQVVQQHGLLFLGIALGTGLIAGLYPAFYLSSFDVANVLKGQFRHRPAAAAFRKVLVVFQFALSILLIISTLIVYQQLDYIQTKNLGLDRENLVYFTSEGGVEDQYEAFKQEALRVPGVEAVTLGSQNPLAVGNSTSDPEWDGKDPDDDHLFHIINTDVGYVEAMGMELLAGRTHSEAYALDSANVIVNEAAAKAMGMADPVGERLAMWGHEGEIIGVVKDFHFDAFYAPIRPLIIRYQPSNTWMVFARLAAGETEEAMAGLAAVYQKFNPSYPFDYTFVDEQFDEQYRNEQVMGQLANIFAGIAIFISCLGLFGLASFTAEQRRKEIGIRKVLGASVPGVVGLLSREFLALVAVSFLVAAPVAWYATDRWLADFTYRIELGPVVFLVAGVVALLIAFGTVSYQALRAAVANPVESLRSE